MATKLTAEALAKRRTEQEQRVADWCDGWARTYVEAYTSAANHLLDLGHLEAARVLHAKILRRFPTRAGVVGFLDLDKRLHAALDSKDDPSCSQVHTDSNATTDRSIPARPSPSPCDAPSDDDPVL